MSKIKYFFPPFFILQRKKNKLRPFISIYNKRNGPGIRMERLIKVFGNNYFNPNLLYAQSGWNIDYLYETLKKSKKANIPFILNQNGWYYPAWYKGDWKKANDYLVKAHKESQLSVFQSQFCLESMKELTNVEPRNYKIIYNCVPQLSNTYIERGKLSRAIIWLSGVFNEDAVHILEPALKAIEILNYELKEYSPKLKIGGYFSDTAKKSTWFKDINKKINTLVEKDLCCWIGKYDYYNLKDLTSDVSLALHLTNKDSCPNAVLERMSLSIGHVYSNSGGTPELIRDSGIGLDTQKNWFRQIPVNVDQLIEGIKLGLDKKEILGKKAFDRVSKQFKFDDYIAKLERIFIDNLNK